MLNPPVLAAAVAGVGYWRGSRVRLRVASGSSQRIRARRLRSLSFAGGLVTVVVTLSEPFDRLSDRWFWVHMSQHLLLVTVAAPLLVLGAPWLAPWRLIGHRSRVRVTRSVGHGRQWRHVRRLGRGLNHPVVAWLLFTVSMFVWHLPAAYDLTLRNDAVHYLEHSLFLATGMLFWLQVLKSPPLPVRLDFPLRVAFLTLEAGAGWILALALILPSHPSYPGYARQQTGGGLSALADQHLAGGMMLVPGSLSYSFGVFYFAYQWMGVSAGGDRLGRRMVPRPRAAAR